MNLNQYYRSISQSFCRRQNPRSLQIALFSTPTQPEESKPVSEKVSAIVDELSSLTLLEVSDLNELLRNKLGTQATGIQFGFFKDNTPSADNMRRA